MQTRIIIVSLNSMMIACGDLETETIPFHKWAIRIIAY
jgi:hypothetical protein